MAPVMELDMEEIRELREVLGKVERRWSRSTPVTALCHNDAEAIIEAVSVLNSDRLGEAACGHGEVIEEADIAEQDQAEAVPAIDESHRGFPRAVGVGIVVVVQAQGDGLVAREDRSPADGVQFLTLVVGQVEAKLVRQ